MPESEAMEAAVRGLERGAQEFTQMLTKSAKNVAALARELQAVPPIKVAAKELVVGEARSGQRGGDGTKKGKAEGK